MNDDEIRPACAAYNAELLSLSCATQHPEKSTSAPEHIKHTLTLDSSLIQLYEQAARMAQSVQTLEAMAM